jgi:hypothetical protein
MVAAIVTGHAPVRRHLYIMGLFNGDPACRFCRMETETVQHIISCCEALADCQTKRHKHSLGKRPLLLNKRHRVIEPVCIMIMIALYYI